MYIPASPYLLILLLNKGFSISNDFNIQDEASDNIQDEASNNIQDERA